jgi:hypothetical protein
MACTLFRLITLLGHTTHMKKAVAIILVVAFNLFAIADIINDFVASDGVHYFSDQPHRLLLVAVIGIAGGLVAFGFSALSAHLQRRAKLVALASGGSFVTLAGGYFSYRVASLPAQLGLSLPWHMPWLLLLSIIAIASLLWFEFFQVFRSRVV